MCINHKKLGTIKGRRKHKMERKGMVKMWEAHHFKVELEAMKTLKMSGCVPPLESRFKIRLKSIHSLRRKTLTMVDTQGYLISPKCSTLVQVLEVPLNWSV